MEGNLKQALQECNATCKELSVLLEHENECLETKKNIKQVEANVKTKKQLTLQLEKFIGVIKVNFESIRQNQEMLRDLGVFKRLIEGYQKLVAKNAMLLKSAYTATSMILNSIQKGTTRPAVKTYNAYGHVQERTEKAAALINYSV